MQKSYYIAEIFLPNKSAYSTHVIKMCNELALKFSSTELIFMYIFLSKIFVLDTQKLVNVHFYANGYPSLCEANNRSLDH